MKVTYTKLIQQDGHLVAVPDDYAERHELVRVEHPLLAEPLVVAAYALPPLPWKEAIAAAEKHTVYGLPMRAPTVEEAFLIPDRSLRVPCSPKVFFPDIEEASWTWTSTPDADSPSGFAWGVDLRDGYSGWLNRGNHNRVRAVRAGQ